MITNEVLNEIVSECKASGYDVKVRDICYSLLCRYFDDAETVYRCLFDPYGTESAAAMDSYGKSTKISFLDGKLKKFAYKQKGKKEGPEITFDENLRDMLKLKEDTQKKMDSGEISFKDGAVILKDIAIKLNDKFDVKEEIKDQIVVVEEKYDAVCPYCSHEVSSRPISKIEAMEMYNLVEKHN